MRSLFLLGSLLAIAACAGAVQGDPPDSSFSPTARSAEDSVPPAAPPANTGGTASSASGDVATTSPATAQPPQATPAASGDPLTQTRSGRFRVELLQDKEFRLVFGDLQRLKVVLDFHESRWGLLKLMVGPGYTTVSSAEFNLERLYRAYKAASYYSNDVVVELWKDGAKLGEVTDDGVLVGSDYKVPRQPY
jgi:hypothetical protein